MQFLVLIFFFAFPAFAQGSGTLEASQFQKFQEQTPADSKVVDFFEQLKANPKDPAVHLALGQYYLDKQLYELAIQAFQRALQFQASYAPAHVGLSHVYRKKGLFPLELQEMELASLSDPNNPQLLYDLGVLYMEPTHFDYKKAKKQYDQLRKLQSPLADSLATVLQIDSK